MELILTIEEFRTLVRSLRGQLEAGNEQRRKDLLQPILEKLLKRDFGFGIDEFETLHEAIQAEKQRLEDPNTVLPESEREGLADTQRVLEHVLDKVVEACAMV